MPLPYPAMTPQHSRFPYLHCHRFHPPQLCGACTGRLPSFHDNAYTDTDPDNCHHHITTARMYLAPGIPTKLVTDLIYNVI